MDCKDIMENGETDKKSVKESDSEYMFSESNKIHICSFSSLF